MREARPGGTRAARLAGALLALGLAAGCSRPATDRAASAGAPPVDPVARAQLLVNAGNQAFHAGDYRLAARRYAAAAVERKDDPVAYFGLGMALTKLGRDEDARAAYAKARELTQRPRRVEP
jgi:Flp pilus assembly protein TadD